MKHLALALTLCLTGAPLAAQSVSASVPQTVLAALRDSGLTAELTLRETEPPLIRATLDGVTFVVFFNNCAGAISCQDLQLRATFQSEGITADVLNVWNRDTFVGKAYLAEDGTVSIEHAVVGVDGLSRFSFQRMLLGWNAALNGFRETFGP